MEQIIPASPCVKSLDIIIDKELIFKNHISHIRYSCYVRHIHTVQPYLTVSSANIIMHSVIYVKWDYRNSLFIDIPDFLSKVTCKKSCFNHYPEFEEVQHFNTLSEETALATSKTAQYLPNEVQMPSKHYVLMPGGTLNPCFSKIDCMYNRQNV